MEEAYKKVIISDFPKFWPDLASGVAHNIKNSQDRRTLQSPLLTFSIVVWLH